MESTGKRETRECVQVPGEAVREVGGFMKKKGWTDVG